MSTEANKTLVPRLFDEGGKVSFAATDELLAEDFRFYFPSNPEPLGKKGWKQVYSMFLSAFPDLHYDIEDIIAEGDRVVARITWSGTQQVRIPGYSSYWQVGDVRWIQREPHRGWYNSRAICLV